MVRPQSFSHVCEPRYELDIVKRYDSCDLLLSTLPLFYCSLIFSRDHGMPSQRLTPHVSRKLISSVAANLLELLL